MNTSLTRSQFVDRFISQDDLQWIAILLADWYHQTRGHLPALTVALNLWGCPGQEEGTLRQRAQERAAFLGVPLMGAPLTAPPGALAPSIGPLIGVFNDPAFHDMAAEIRLTLADTDPRTLVLYGSVQNGAFLLKALWPVGSGDFKEVTYSHAAWPYEAQFLNALSAYQNGNPTIPDWGRSDLFPNPIDRTWRNGLTWFLSPEDKKGVQGYLLRVALAGGAFAVALWGVTASLRSHSQFLSLVVPGLVIAGLGLIYTLGQKMLMISQTLSRMRANLRGAYNQPIAFPEIDLANIPGALQDPAVRKLSAEITALGGQHYKDITIQPGTAGQSWVRLYLFPEDATVFTAMFLYRSGKLSLFPAKPTFLLRTNLSDGYRLASTSGGSGYRKPLPLPVISYTFPSVNDPAEMLRKHRAMLVQAEQAGRKRVPIEPEHLITQMIAEHEQNGSALAKYGYFQWDDAVRMVFKLPRPQYRE